MDSTDSDAADDRRDRVSILYMELKPNIHSAQVVINTRNCRNVEIRDERLTVDLAATSSSSCTASSSCSLESVTFDLSDLPQRLRAGTCTGLQRTSGGSEVHFRLQTKKPAAPSSSSLSSPSSGFSRWPAATPGLNTRASSSSSRRRTPEDSVRSACRAACSLCLEPLLTFSRFTRVLDMPPDGWSDMADTWFCHDHGCGDGSSSQRAAAAIAPKDDELLIGEYYLLVSRGAVASAGTMTLAASSYGNADVQCRRCCHWLGELVEGVTSGVKLCLVELELQDADGSKINRGSNCSPESGFLSWIISHSHRHACSRFVLLRQQSPGQSRRSEPYMLLWLIDTDLQLVFGNARGQMNLCAGRKVLYMACPFKDSRLTEQWKSDPTTQTIELPHRLCLRLLAALKDSTRRMPLSLVQISGFFVGFLADSEMQM